MEKIDGKRMYSLSEIESLGLLPFKWRTLRNLAASGRLNAENVGAGTKKSRWKVKGTDIVKFIGEMGSVGRNKKADT